MLSVRILPPREAEENVVEVTLYDPEAEGTIHQKWRISEDAMDWRLTLEVTTDE